MHDCLTRVLLALTDLRPLTMTYICLHGRLSYQTNKTKIYEAKQNKNLHVDGSKETQEILSCFNFVGFKNCVNEMEHTSVGLFW